MRRAHTKIETAQGPSTKQLVISFQLPGRKSPMRPVSTSILLWLGIVTFAVVGVKISAVGREGSSSDTVAELSCSSANPSYTTYQVQIIGGCSFHVSRM